MVVGGKHAGQEEDQKLEYQKVDLVKSYDGFTVYTNLFLWELGRIEDNRI